MARGGWKNRMTSELQAVLTGVVSSLQPGTELS